MQHIWIFQLRDTLSEAQRAAIVKNLDVFLADWKAHGAPVPGRQEIRHDRFVIVQAEPGSTSGCSIDAMTRGVTGILADAGVEALERNFVFYRKRDGAIAHFDFREAPVLIAAGEIDADSIVFDCAMGNTTDLDRFEVRLKDSWLSRYLPQEA